MYAVIETGGKQYRVSPGEIVNVETIPAENQSQIDLGRVVAIGDGGVVRAGKDVADAKVKATVLNTGREEKVLVFKFKRKKQYKRTQGHRQNFTRVKVDEILLGGNNG
jgi:large subunit ribosomal protein L21